LGAPLFVVALALAVESGEVLEPAALDVSADGLAGAGLASEPQPHASQDTTHNADHLADLIVMAIPSCSSSNNNVAL
jgi:hypothetical protein